MTRPGAVLFACNLNRVRSPLALGLMQRLFGGQIFVDSCGVRTAPADGPDPFVLTVLDELGVDLSRHKPKSFDDLQDQSFDVVISLSPQAHHTAVELTRRQAVELEYWPTQDPTGETGSRETVLETYRAVRDALDRRIRERFGAVRTFGG